MPEPITGMDGSVRMVAAGGALAALASVRSFAVNVTADNKQYATSDTAGWKKSAEGKKSWNGTITIYLNDGTFPTWESAQAVDVELTSATGKTGTGTGRIDSIENIDVNIEESGMIGCTLNITGSGELIFAG